MWKNTIGGIVLISLTIAVVARFKYGRAHNRWKWFLGYILSIIGLLFASSYPIENWFYSFSSIEALAQYACDGELVLFVDGSDSCFIVCRTRSEKYSYMISPKTESGYKIGRLSAHRELSKTVSMQYVVTIVQSDGSSDAYVLIGGLSAGQCKGIQDSRNSSFVSETFPETPINGEPIVRILASAYLGDHFDAPYEIGISDANGTATVRFP